MAKNDRKYYVKKLDKIFSEYIRLRDKKCICCGSIENLQCGHYITRGKYSIRWDEENCNAQCAGCNLKHNTNPAIYTLALCFKYGNGIIEKLQNKALNRKKISTIGIIVLIEHYKEKVDKIKE